jgi:hypothetical protein
VARFAIEYDKESGKVEFLATPLKHQVEEGKTPAARGKKTTISNPERVYATQFWLHRHGEGHGAMLPEHEAKFGKAPVFAKTLDGRLHLLEGTTPLSIICAKASGRCARLCSIFKLPFFKMAMARRGPGRGHVRFRNEIRDEITGPSGARYRADVRGGTVTPSPSQAGGGSGVRECRRRISATWRRTPARGALELLVI